MVWPPLTGLDNNLCAQRIGQPRSFHADADPDDPLRMLFAPGRSLGVVGDAQQKNSGRLTRSAARWKLLKLELYEALPAGATDAGLLDALAAVGIDSSLPESVECIGEKEFVAIVGELRARHAGTWVGQWESPREIRSPAVGSRSSQESPLARRSPTSTSVASQEPQLARRSPIASSVASQEPQLARRSPTASSVASQEPQMARRSPIASSVANQEPQLARRSPTASRVANQEPQLARRSPTASSVASQEPQLERRSPTAGSRDTEETRPASRGTGISCLRSQEPRLATRSPGSSSRSSQDTIPAHEAAVGPHVDGSSDITDGRDSDSDFLVSQDTVIARAAADTTHFDASSDTTYGDGADLDNLMFSQETVRASDAAILTNADACSETTNENCGSDVEEFEDAGRLIGYLDLDKWSPRGRSSPRRLSVCRSTASGPESPRTRRTGDSLLYTVSDSSVNPEASLPASSACSGPRSRDCVAGRGMPNLDASLSDPWSLTLEGHGRPQG